MLPLHLPTPSTPFVNPISAEESSASVGGKKNTEQTPPEPVQIKVNLTPKKEDKDDPCIARVPTADTDNQS